MLRLNIHVSKLTLPCMQCLLVMSLLSAVASCIANNLGQRASAGPVTGLVSNINEERRGAGQLLVTLLDGKLLSLDPELGTVNWSLDLGSPLLSSSGIWYENSQDSEEPMSHLILPGADGSLYIFSDALGASQALERLPATIPQLVEASPSATQDGALLLGSLRSSVYVVEATTGTLTSVLLPDGDGTLGSSKTDAVVPAQLDLTNSVLLGRKDFTVQSIDAMLGQEKWNVTFAQLNVLAPAHLAANADHNQLLPQADLATAGLMGITAGPLNTLHRRDPQSGVGLWTLQLDSPAVAVHLADGTSLKLHGSTATSDNASTVVVGTLHGSMYALPVAADWLQSLLPAVPVTEIIEYQLPEEAAAAAAGSESSSELLVSRGAHSQSAGSHQHARSSALLNSQHQLFIKSAAPDASARTPDHTKLPSEVHARNLDQPSGAVRQPAGKERQAQKAGSDSTALMHLPVRSGEGPEAHWQCPVSLHSVVTGTSAQSFLPNLTDPSMEQGGAAEAAAASTWAGLTASNHMWAAAAIVIVVLIAMAALYCWRKSLPTQAADVPDTEVPLPAGSAVVRIVQAGSNTNTWAAVTVPNQAQAAGSTAKPQAAAAGKKARRKAHSSKYGPPCHVSGSHKGNVLRQSDEHRADALKDVAVFNAKGNDANDASGDASLAEGSVQSGRSSKARITHADGTTAIGHMKVGPRVLGYGSQGTMVFEGSLHGRAVAVKRMLHHLYHLAKKEIDALILSDEHACVVRCFALEEDGEFVYLALERCKQSLADMVAATPSQQHMFMDGEGHPTPWCMQVAEDIGQGLLALHERGIVHCDLKPHNVLLTSQQRAKVSDMGHCKRLLDQQASFESPGAGGSSGWQAPEQLVARSGGEARQGYSTDVFSYGMLLFYCLTAGKHPFGHHYERDFNILQGRCNLKAIEHLPEAQEMVQSMLAARPAKRPTMQGSMEQLFWWSPARRLAFLIHLSDRIETEDREVDQTLLHQLEAVCEDAIGGASWGSALEPEVIANLGKYRKYNSSSLRDLLRVIRNKHNHFREMPPDLQQRLGPLPEGFLRYFTSRFPRLLMTTYKFAQHHCSSDPPLRDYFFHQPLQAQALPLQGPPKTAGHALNAPGHVQDGPASSPQPASQGPQFRTVSVPGMPSLGEGSESNASIPKTQCGNDTVPGKAFGDVVPPPSFPEQCSINGVEVAKPPASKAAISGTFRGDAIATSCTVRDGVTTKGSMEAASKLGASALVSTSPGPPEKFKMRPGADQRKWWPRQSFYHNQASPTAAEIYMAGSNTAAKAASAASAEDAESSEAVPGSVSQRPAAALAAWAVRQQSLSNQGDGLPKQVDQEQSVQSGLGEGLLSLDEAWPSLQEAAGVRQHQQLPKQLLELAQGVMSLQECAEQKLPQQLPLHGGPQLPAQQSVTSFQVRADVPPDSVSACQGSDHFSHTTLEAVALEDCCTEVGDSGHNQQKGLQGSNAMSYPGGLDCTEPGQHPCSAHGLEAFPQRPGQMLCDFYLRTGFCKFRQACKFDHPVEFAVKMNSVGLPLRTHELACPYYAKNGSCKFGPSCKFHHPELCHPSL
ncbi:TPA: bifunctional endoribonuclease/protein kinase ire1 [Trebouxia sp. C0004]